MRSFIVTTLLFGVFRFGVCITFDWFNNQSIQVACLSKDYVFRFSVGSTLKKCVSECVAKPMCKAFNFHRNYPFCELLNQDFGTISNHAQPCLLVKRSDIVVSLPKDCEQCTEGETCDIDKQTNSGSCVIEECKPLSLTNGQIMGNMNTIGSRIAYMCDEGYTPASDITFSVCQPDGNWEDEPECVPDRLVLDFCPGIILADGKTYPLGVINETGSFGGGYNCKPRNPNCLGNGTWESLPGCNEQVIALYLGCYVDCLDRQLDAVYLPQHFNPATTEHCIDLCSSNGYKFASTQAGSYCFCGHEVLHFTKADESQCNTACVNDTSQFCGGPWRSSLYNIVIPTEEYGVVNKEDVCATDGTCIGACENTPLVYLTV